MLKTSNIKVCYYERYRITLNHLPPSHNISLNVKLPDLPSDVFLSTYPTKYYVCLSR